MNATARLPQVNIAVCLALIAFGLLLLSAVAGSAEGNAPRQAKVIILVRSSSPEDNPALSALIADSMSMELHAREIDVIPSTDLAADDTALRALEEKTHADFALSGVYEVTGSAVRLSVGWIDLADMREAGRASRSGELNLAFDDLVAGIVDELVEGQRDAIAALLPEAPSAGPAPSAQPEPEVPAEPPAPAGPVTAASAAAPAPPVIEPPAGKEARLAPLAFSIGSAPFIATFTALNYFPLGFAVTLNGRYQMRVTGGFLGIGILTGVSGFSGRGAYTQADFYVVPIGVDVLYGTLTGGRFDFFVHVGAGPAVLAAKPASGNLLAKVIPYALGGVGISWAMIDILAVSLDASYTCYFDSSAAIMGFTPSLSAVLKL
jgi:hypothetical protein